MADIKIEGGCYQLKGQVNTWAYAFTDMEGIHKILFLVPEGETPEIGDFIDNGVLKKREGLQINPDTSKWRRKWKEIWGN